VVANDWFAWGRNAAGIEGYGRIGDNGLEIQPGQAFAQLGIEQGAAFGSDPPFLLRGFNPYGDEFQPSVRIFDPLGAAPPIPEPAEWSMLLAGLSIVAFVANRRRRVSA
jgi:hypothetical protein